MIMGYICVRYIVSVMNGGMWVGNLSGGNV